MVNIALDKYFLRQNVLHILYQDFYLSQERGLSGGCLLLKLNNQNYGQAYMTTSLSKTNEATLDISKPPGPGPGGGTSLRGKTGMCASFG